MEFQIPQMPFGSLGTLVGGKKIEDIPKCSDMKKKGSCGTRMLTRPLRWRKERVC
jgi:hypothetical protein